MARIRIQHLCDRCSQDVTACADCDRGSRFIERQRTLGVSYNSLYNREAFLVARERALTSRSVPEIERVIFAEPATIVFWADGTKTVVKCQDGDVFDHELGLAMAIAKRALGNTGNYNNVFKKWLPKEKKEETKTIIGKIASFEQNEDGIYATVDMNTTVDGRALLDAIKQAPVGEMSISFDVKEKK